jgi:hypothetical protein
LQLLFRENNTNSQQQGFYAYDQALEIYRDYKTFVLPKASPAVGIFLDGAQGNVTVSPNSTVNITAISSDAESDITVWSNSAVLASGRSVVFDLGAYGNDTNITVTQPSSQNYSEAVPVTLWVLMNVSAPSGGGGGVSNLTWSNNQSSTPSTYSSAINSAFNITWTANQTLDTVLIEGNWNGTAVNYTAVNFGNGIYNHNSTLPAGTFYWKSYANDTLGNWNSTDTWHFTINSITQQPGNPPGGGGGGGYYLVVNTSGAARTGTVLLSITADPSSLAIEKGGSATSVLHVSNAGTAPANVTFIVGGVPSGWITGLDAVNLGANEAKDVDATVTGLEAGNRTLTITASTGQNSASVSIPLVVNETTLQEPGPTGAFLFNAPALSMEMLIVGVLVVLVLALSGVFARMMGNNQYVQYKPVYSR